MPHVICILGTRPEIIKMAPVIQALSARRNVKLTLVHSGQHYDIEMSGCFFKELGLRRADMNLEVGSGSHGVQTARILSGYERVITQYRPDLVLAEGDTNTVLAAGLASVKLKVCFGHVEAGLRCFDRTMPEEINRTIADDCAQFCFAPTERSAANLLREGISPDRIFITGNPIVEACRDGLERALRQSRILEDLQLTREKPLVLITAHREENVDNPNRLRNILTALLRMDETQVVYPIHPRTRKRLETLHMLKVLRNSKHIKITKPLGYLDFLRLMKASDIVLTDSGGVQEEGLTLGVPCLTLRYNTERPETIEAGGNRLVGTDPSLIVREVRRQLKDGNLCLRPESSRNPLGDGKAGKRIADICANADRAELRIDSTIYMKDGAASFRLIPVRKERKLSSLHRQHPAVTVSQVYDSDGILIFPESNLRLRREWHIQAFGQASDLARLIPYLEVG